MCGIVGFFGFGDFDNIKIIKGMTNRLQHRGPDFSSTWINKENEIAFGHTRLSIIDLSSGGNQPMTSKNKRYTIVFNGEIYNYKQIQKKYDLNCISRSDTEVLLESISNIGLKSTLNICRGMFAFVLFDNENKELFLCRDRIGEKPLYYGWLNNTFVFCSELKALKYHPYFNNEVNRNSLSLLTKYNYIPAPNTIYNDIYKLESGKILTIKNNSFSKISFDNNRPVTKNNFIIESYWKLEDQIIKSKKNIIHDKQKAINLLESKLNKVIKMQSYADVPIGSFLSGGIDSSLITTLMQMNSNNKINTFTIGSFDKEYNEANYAKKIAKHLNTNHTELYISAKDALNIIPTISRTYDEPFADSSQLPTILISELTKKFVKVSLSGDGGDELFGGYNRYLKGPLLWNFINIMPTILKSGTSSILKNISNKNYNRIEKFINIFLSSNKKMNFLSTKFNRLAYRLNNTQSRLDLFINLVTEWSNANELVLNSNEPYNYLTQKKNLDFLSNFEEEMMFLDTLTYLPDDILTKVDRATMSFGLESRSPFLDHHIIELSWMIDSKLKINKGIGKNILRDILYKHVPRKLVDRPKQGFGIPLGLWLRGPLKDWANDLLNENKIKSEGYFNHKIVQNRLKSHFKGENNWEFSLWSILMFQSWNDNI